MLEFEFNLRPLGNFSSGRMDDDDERIGGTKKVGGNGKTASKSTRTVFVHHKAHM